MSDSMKLQAAVEMSVEQPVKALDQIGVAADKMAGKVDKAAAKAGGSVDGIGAGAGASADQMTRAEGRMVASIKRVQTQMDLAGKTASQKLEFNIAAKGLDAAKFEPYLAQLRATEAAQERVATGAAEAAGKMAGLAAVAAGGAFAMWVKGAIDAADSLNDLSKSTSIAVETLAGLKLASKQSGAELEGTAQAINKLSVNMGANAAKFAAIGVTAKEPLEAFKQLADVFAKIDDPQMKAAFGAEALGKSWAAAAPLLAEGGQSIQDMVDKGSRLSGVTQKLADDADAFNDVLEEWKVGISGVASGIASGLLPVMLAMSENMSAVTGKADGMNSSFSPVTETLRAVAVLGGNVAFVLRAVGTEFGGMAAQVATAAKGDFAGARTIGKMMTEDAVLSRDAFDKWEATVLSAGQSVAKAKTEVVALTEAQKASVRAFSESGKAAKEAKEDFTELFQRAEQMKTIYAALGVEMKDIEKQNEDYAKSIAALIDPVEKEATSLERQAETYGLTRSQIEQTTIARLEEAKAMATMNDAGEDAIAYYEREIDARKRIAAASASIESRKATDDAAKHAADEWKKTSDKIGDSITDALMRGFESGKSFAETLRDTVVNMFKTMVLKPVIQATVISGMSALGMGSSSAMAGDSGIGSIGNLISTGNSIMNIGTTLAQGYGALPGTTTLAEGVGMLGGDSIGTLLATNPQWATVGTSIGEAAGAALATGAETAGTMLIEGVAVNTAQYVGMIEAGAVASEALAATAVAVEGTAAAAGSAALAAVPVVGWVALAALAAYSMFSKDGGGPKTEGDYFGTLTSSGALAQQSSATGGDGAWFTGGSADAQLAGMAPTLGKAVYEAVTALGGSAAGIGINYGYNTDPQGTAPDNVSAGVTDASGNYVYRTTYDVDREGASAALQLEMQRITLFAIQAADGIKPIFREWTAGIDIATASAETMTQAISDLQGIVGLRSAFDNLNLGADALSVAIIKAAGGVSTLSSELDSYYSSYFTTAEKTANVAEQVSKAFADVGLAMPANKAAFRAVVEGLDLTTVAGQETFAAMMGLSSAFAQVADARTAEIESTYATQSAYYKESLSAVEKIRDTFVSLSSTLSSAMETLSPSSSISAIAARSSAQASLDAILATANSGQSIAPFADAISAAVSTLVQPAEDIYANFDDYSRAQGRAIAVIAGLQSAVSGQQSVAEMTLAAINSASAATDAKYVSDIYANSHADGLERVPYDGYRATLHAGEAVIDAPAVSALSRYFGGGGGNNTERLESLVAALTQEVVNLRAEARATAVNTNKSAKLLERAMPDGDALATRITA